MSSDPLARGGWRPRDEDEVPAHRHVHRGVRAARPNGGSGTTGHCSIFDQFEEILTLFEAEAATSRCTGQLAEMVVRLLRDPLPVKLLLTFREDYLGSREAVARCMPGLVDQALRLGPPSADALHTIIRGPFERFPGHFARQLPAVPGTAVERRARRALRGRRPEPVGGADGLPAAVGVLTTPEACLPRREFRACSKTSWASVLAPPPAPAVTPAVAVLSHMVTSAWNPQCHLGRGPPANASARRTPEIAPRAPWAKRSTSLSARPGSFGPNVAARLYLYEITSEFLVPWISRRREDLRLAQERRRGRHRLRIMSAIAAALLLVAAIIAVVAVEAVNSREDANQAAKNANSLALTAAAAEPPRSRPDLSLALAFEAYRTLERPEASAALIKARLDARRSGLRGVLRADAA